MTGFSGSTVRHGTTSGYKTHQNRGERPCDACVRAKQEYDARWRSGSERTRQSRLLAGAQKRALTRLKNLYPDLYAALYAEEKERGFRDAGDVEGGAS